MTGFALVLLLIIIILLLIMKSNFNARLQKLEHQIKNLQQALVDALEKNITPEIKERTTPSPDPMAQKKEEEQYWETSVKVVEDEPTAITNLEEESRIEEWLKEPTPVNQGEALSASMVAATKVTEPVQSPQRKSTFFERNPDLEKFIGENLVNKIGIGILVLAIGYFVKFAIDQNWIGTIGRVAIGLICGAILIGIAHRMRNSYKAFSSVLVGGGIAVFYFTIALAYHQFHLFSQTAAFVVMLLITIFAVILSIWYDKQEVAIIALVGGFAAPFMVSDGSGNYKTLFIYLVLLNAGLLVIAYSKAWRLVNLLAFIFTIILVGGWLLSLSYREPQLTYSNAFIFCTIFYMLFFAINLAHNVRENKKFIASDFGILLANTSLYFAAGLSCLYYMNAYEYKGLFSAAMGVFNLVASYLLFKNRKVDINILYLLIGITLTFVSLTAPLQLNGNYITLFWASEAVLLLWLYQKSSILIIRISSHIVWSCMLISLAMDWADLYRSTLHPLSIIVNKAFITTLYASAACYILYLLQKAERATNAKERSGFSTVLFYSVALMLLYTAGALEINHQFRFYYPATHLAVLYLQLYTCAFVIALLFTNATSAYAGARQKVEMLLLSVCILIYLVLAWSHYDEQRHVLETKTFSIEFNLAHWMMAVFTAIVIAKLIASLRANSITTQSSLTTWLLCSIIIVFVSVEINLLIRSLFYSNANPLSEIQRVFNKTVMPIVWGVSSFVFMWLGMKFKYRTLRIISLTLFSVTLLKLFMFDIRNIPVAGKIAAFFCLGVLLLVVSFMYQRLKKIIIEDEKKPAA